MEDGGRGERECRRRVEEGGEEEIEVESLSRGVRKRKESKWRKERKQKGRRGEWVEKERLRRYGGIWE